MRKLERKLGRDDTPKGLHYKHGRDQWGGDIPNKEERSDIWKALGMMQKCRCAYCEATITADDRHIEHFASRDDYPKGTFEWSNLFGSCDQKESCGEYKDQGGKPYNWRDLIKPDVDDPDDYFLFSTDGNIAPLAGLSKDKLKRAVETLRVFNLNRDGLRWARQKVAAGYKPTVEYLRGLWDESPELRETVREEANSLLNETADMEFSTVIRHMLTVNIW